MPPPACGLALQRLNQPCSTTYLNMKVPTDTTFYFGMSQR